MQNVQLTFTAPVSVSRSGLQCRAGWSVRYLILLLTLLSRVAPSAVVIAVIAFICCVGSVLCIYCCLCRGKASTGPGHEMTPMRDGGHDDGFGAPHSFHHLQHAHPVTCSCSALSCERRA